MTALQRCHNGHLVYSKVTQYFTDSAYHPNPITQLWSGLEYW